MEGYILTLGCTEVFLGEDLRQQVLEMKPSAELFGDENSHLVYASIVDMHMGDSVVSLACVADGTTSLYFSTGGGQIGSGSK